MSHAFAKDSRACAACVSWGGERTLSEDSTLVHVTRHGVEGECRTASSQDYRRITKGYHTCTAWAPLPMLKKHGGRVGHPHQPVFATPMAPPVPQQPASAKPSSTPASAVPAVPETEAPASTVPCTADVIDIDRLPPQVRIIYTHWLRLKRKRPMPLAHEIDPSQVRETVPRLCLMEPVEGGRDFLYRACGRALQRRLAQRAVPRTVTALHPEQAAQRWLSDLRLCLESGEPRCLLVRDDPMLPGVRFVEMLLPLAEEEGGKATRVLAYRHVPGG